MAQKEKTFFAFKRLFAYFVTEKLPRFACLLPALGQQKQAESREIFYRNLVSDASAIRSAALA
ncbi:hypothetical protein C9Z68_02555 [Escherichia coli]|uniref:Uncharacterized protein n=1 Tax=Escherichia coli TaxID=562 RepID=A0A4T8J9R4_ECOLX|nr:hypothetical protein C9Z68_02555 [Escherichia coli]